MRAALGKAPPVAAKQPDAAFAPSAPRAIAPARGRPQAISSAYAPAPPEVQVKTDWLAFWASVAVILTFSQFWVSLITGTGPGPIDEAVSARVRNFYFPFYFVVLILGLTNLRATAKMIMRAPLMTLLIALPFISMLWSIDPGVTVRRSIAVMFTSLAGVVIASRFKWATFLEVLATTFAIVVTLCYLYGAVIPDLGRMKVEFPGAWQGVWGHKNTLGFNASIGFMIFASAAIANPRRWWLWAMFAVGALGLLFLSQSKTSLVSFAAGCACIGMVALARRGPASAVLATFIGGAAVILLTFIIFADPDLLLGALGKDSTLTGRTKIWGAVLHQIHLRPVTGYGYGAVWDDTSIWGPLAWISKEQGFTIHEAHNSWLGLWLELGYFGVAVAALLFIELWGRTLIAIYGQMRAYLALSFLAVFTLHTMTETEIMVQNDWLWMMFTAIAVKMTSPSEESTGRSADLDRTSP